MQIEKLTASKSLHSKSFLRFTSFLLSEMDEMNLFETVCMHLIFFAL